MMPKPPKGEWRVGRKRAGLKPGLYKAGRKRRQAAALQRGRVEARSVAPGGAGDEGFCWLLNVGALRGSLSEALRAGRVN
jgi:hypothetical protein